MAGRKRKKGKRERNGRLSRKGQVRYDKGSDHTQAMQALYGQDGCDAVGRAFRAGLLGEGQDAKAMLDKARQMAKAYWSDFEVGPLGCAIGDRAGGSTPSISAEDARRREDAMNAALGTVEGLGRAYRRDFDALAIDPHPDSGPDWLDRLLGFGGDLADLQRLERSVEALAAIAGVDCPKVGARKRLDRAA